jgi:AraC family transcriptional regulator, regulatory protein of adaptative response / methylated-DNA-[protein]-cysteine methyltransferase
MPLPTTTPIFVPFASVTDDDRYEAIRRPAPAAAGAFYYSVAKWSELRAAAGTTTTYGEIAARIGTAGAVRAVAVPCHRLLRRDGSLDGYRWRVDRKRELLAREGAR